MGLFTKRRMTFNSADEAITEASRYSRRNKWRKAYDVYSDVIGQLSPSASPRDMARLYNERAFMARNIGGGTWKSGDSIASEEWYRRAHQDYDLAIQRDSSFWRPWFNKANLLARDQRRFREALPYYNRAAELNPQHADIFNNRGLTNEALGNTKDALQDFETVLTIDPSHADAHSNIGTVLYEQGHFREAADWYERAAILNPLDPDYRHNRDLARSRM